MCVRVCALIVSCVLPWSLTGVQVFFILPFFLVGCGGVLLFDGLQIYQYYEVEKEDKEPNVYIVDKAQDPLPEIHKEDKYIVVEFSGAIASGLFYVSC